MTDQELFLMLAEYAKENGYSFVTLAKLLEVSKNTINNWKNGGNINPESRRGILALIGKTPSQNCFLDHCPATPPVDRMLQAILESWEFLSQVERAQVAGIALELAEPKKESGSKASASSKMA